MGGTGGAEPGRLLHTLERLLAIEEVALDPALDRASHLVAEALRADKVDIAFHDPSTDSLVAVGTSRTPMGRRQHAIGMNRLPVANGGREVEVFQTGVPHLTGRADQDPEQLPGFTRGLGVRSSMVVPFDIGGVRRGVLIASSARPDFFSADDLRFFEAVARWVGVVAHRGDLLEHVTTEAKEQGRRLAADELIAVLAHDLGNRLAPLKTRIDLIRRRARREGRERDLQDADDAARAVDRFGRLIADLLDAARLEQGIFALDPRPVDVTGVTRETARAFETGIPPIRVEGPEEVVACVDADRVRQALANLLANAVKHSPRDAPVTVGVEEVVGEGDRWAVVTVADRGPGIPPELQPRIFGRFERGSGSGGLGLGLYLASGIAAAHGGTLTVDSTPGAGARFRLALPADGSGPQPGG